MITGRFGNTTGRPYVNGRLFFPRINSVANISFLVDTGADVSALMPTDAIKMGVDYNELTSSTNVGGIGGNAACFEDEALLIFNEPNRNLVRYYAITIKMLQPHPGLQRTPTILGRDVLDRWHMRYDPSKGKLSFKVRSADHTVKIP